jgi:pimeloyl-ACP methyl ester carboxylesterase
MRPFVLAAALALCAVPPSLAQAAPIPAVPVPAAVIADPPRDVQAPARMEVIHVPSGGVEINGVVLVAAGAGPHPAFVLFHGLPGNEKNLDLAQAVRRAGWTVVTVNYRGSWGSPGLFGFAHNLEDARATLAYVRDPANAARLGIDPRRIALGGHSMGGWVTAETAAVEPGLLGAVTISAGDIGAVGALPPAAVLKVMADNRETLTASPQAMADEVIAHAADWRLDRLGPRLKDVRLLVLHSDDGLDGQSRAMIAAIRAAGGAKVSDAHVATDHGWSDKRITLEALVVNFLGTLPGAP